MRKILPLLLMLSVFQTEGQASSFDNVTILVTSCDKYSSLWGRFFHQLFQKWPELKGIDQNVPIHLVANEKAYNNPRIYTSHTIKKESWSNNILQALQDVKTDYVLILLDDYYLTQFDRQRLMDIYDYMRSHPTVSYVQITQVANITLDRPVGEIDGLYHKAKHSPWRTSLQACLWKKTDLQHLLRPGESAWDFEMSGSVRSEGLKGEFLITTDKFPLSYLNVAQEGYVYEHTINAAKAEGIEIHTDLPREKDHKFYLCSRRWVRSFYLEVWAPFKTFAQKNILSLLP